MIFFVCHHKYFYSHFCHIFMTLSKPCQTSREDFQTLLGLPALPVVVHDLTQDTKTSNVTHSYSAWAVVATGTAQSRIAYGTGLTGHTCCTAGTLNIGKKITLSAHKISIYTCKIATGILTQACFLDAMQYLTTIEKHDMLR